jgi:tetratricopeptide (TPR) repeat protein
MLHKSYRLIPLVAITAAALFASAQDQEDPIETAIRLEHSQDAEKLIDARLKVDQFDPIALHGLMELAVDDHTGSEARRTQVLEKLQGCIAAKPKAALCQVAYGDVLGVQAMSTGLMSAARSIGKIKDAFLAAVAADPSSFEARDALIQFYLMAPGIMGGSVKEARKQADAFAAIDPQRVHLLRARVAIYEKEFKQADAEFRSVAPGANDAELKRDLAGSLVDAGFNYLQAKEYAAANAAFERASRDADIRTLGHAVFGQGRVALAQNQYDNAITYLNKSMTIDPWINAHYRVATALEQKGDKPHAAAEYEAFLHFSPAPQGDQADDARKHLQALKS